MILIGLWYEFVYLKEEFKNDFVNKLTKIDIYFFIKNYEALLI